VNSSRTALKLICHRVAAATVGVHVLL